MKYIYTCMLGISFCAAMLLAPVREALIQGEPARAAFSQPDLLEPPKVRDDADKNDMPEVPKPQKEQEKQPEEPAPTTSTSHSTVSVMSASSTTGSSPSQSALASSSRGCSAGLMAPPDA